MAQVQVQFSQSSDPPALINNDIRLVATGSLVSTVSAPMKTGTYQFVHWTFTGVRQQDPIGRGINPVRFMVVEPVDAVARYILATDDTDMDGIPDWFEWHFYGSLTHGATSDTDGDGITLQDEFWRDYHPNVVDTIVNGGISQRGGVSFFVIQDPGVVIYQATSSPPGVLVLSQPVATNSTQLLPDVYGVSFGYRFAQWEVNGIRVADALGRSVGNLGLTIASNTAAVAIFLSSTASSLEDGVPDWFKLHHYGTTSISATNDSDADGLTLFDEYTRDTHPNLVDNIADGGISRRTSELIGFRNPGYVWYSEESDPPGIIANQLILVTNTLRVLPDVRTNGTALGYAFAEWQTNGVRVADALGRAVGGLTIMVATDITATAVYMPTSRQTTGDGVPDWFKWQFYAATNVTADSDTDADGFTLLQEYNRDYHPNVKDAILDGGISGRASGLIFVFVPYFYRVESSPPDIIPTISDFVQYGTKIQTTNAPSQSGGSIFGHWKVGGLRQADENGYPRNPVSFNIYSNTVATAVYYPASADTNANGLPDWWEDYHFGGPTAADANADSDGDGLLNRQEYIAGTNPRLALSRFAITTLQLSPEGWEITFLAVSGKVYRVEYNSHLSRTNGWQILLDNFQATNSIIQILDPTANNEPSRFYRLRVFQ
ncbi:MAG: hypothetical protein FJ395_05855 [Verrucomicrobia bacterium]|nr:hypothetical protein [Verrucomicrobiota bacterium]